jgi:prepilin-type N-terminal cleavage/methylation domain-containing protein
MKRMRLSNRLKKAFVGHSRGFTLVEVLITIGLLGFIALAFFSFMSAATSSLIHADERTIAESLARSQMEYVKNHGYIEDKVDGVDGEATYETIPNLAQIAPGYTIESINLAGEPVADIVGIVWDNSDNMSRPASPDKGDTGLQMVALVIKHGDRVLYTFVNANPDWPNSAKITLEGYVRK